MNKKLNFLSAVLFLSSSLLQASRTILVPRQVSTDPTLELSLAYHQEYSQEKEDDTFSWSIYATPFYQSSSRSSKIAGYFLPCCYGSGCSSCCSTSCLSSCCSSNCNSCNTCLSVRYDGLGNIGAPWLFTLAGVDEHFNSCLCFCPKYTKAGVLFNLRFNFDNWINGLWLSTGIAPLQATNKLDMCEMRSGSAGSITGFTTIFEALNSCKPFFCNKVNKWGVDDIQVKLGYSLDPRERWLLELYLAGLIPTSNSQKACYFFEPQVGNGGHGGLGFGTSGAFHLVERETSAWDLIFDLKYLYLFRRSQCRSFDLCNGDWSRYLLCAFEDATTVGLPLRQLLIKNCTVTPGSQISLWGTFHYEHKNWQFELGGNFWWKQEEDVKLYNTCLSDVGIYDLAGALIGNPVSASNARIWQTAAGANAAPSDSIFTKINPCNIDVYSGTQPRVYTFRVLGNIGYEAKENDWPWLLGVGGFYEWAGECMPFNQWGVLLKLGIHF